LPEREKSGDEYLFEIGAFLISSAKGCLWEPKLYGPLRIIPLVVSDSEKFEQFIKDLGMKLAKEIKKRKIR